MFYKTSEPHGLPHNPLNALVAPRPIGWISTIDAQGRFNLAPYSFFNAVAYHPPQAMFSSLGRKDTVRNIQETGQFVVNLATYALREQMNATSVAAPHGVSEFEYAGLKAAASRIVKPPRVAESPVHLECELAQIVELIAESGHESNFVVFGKVLGVEIADWAIVDGLVDTAKLQPLARLGYDQYCYVKDVFSLPRPEWTGEQQSRTGPRH
jgi:flavin reductase (DIM6/NTAB) family NADH-FMN oxidoreductase RutF